MPDLSFPFRQGLRILVVEDDYQVAESLAEILETLGGEVIGPAATAEQATRLIEQRGPDVSILDVGLTKGTTATVARALRERGCPFLFLTGYADDALLPEDLRGSPLLTKPVECATMLSAIRSLLGGGIEDGRMS